MGKRQSIFPVSSGQTFNHCSTKQPIAAWSEKAKHYIEEEYILGGIIQSPGGGDGREPLRCLPGTAHDKILPHTCSISPEVMVRYVGASRRHYVKLEDGVLHTFP